MLDRFGRLSALVLWGAISCGDGDGRPVGIIDAASMAACAVFPDGTALTASATLEGAGAAEVHVESARLVTLDDEGYVTLHADVGHFDWAIFTSEDTTLANDELGFAGATRAGPCPDVGLWDHRVHIHEAGEYVLHMHHHGSSPVFLYAYRTESSHSFDGGPDHDAGHMHDDGGHSDDGGHGDDGGHSHDDGGHAHDDGGHAH